MKEKEQKSIKLSCDNCKAELPVSSYTFATKKVVDLEVDYLECPVCSNRVVIILKDKQQKALLKELKMLNHRLEVKHRLNKPVSSSFLRQFQKAFVASKEHQEGLRTEYLTAVTEQLNKSDV